MTEKPRYATLSDLAEALEKLEQKVPSRWEVRTLILGAIVLTNYDLPNEVTTTAVAVGVLSLGGAIAKGVLIFFGRS